VVEVEQDFQLAGNGIFVANKKLKKNMLFVMLMKEILVLSLIDTF